MLGAVGAVVGAVAGALTAEAGTDVVVPLLEWLCIQIGGCLPKGMLC